ncbi:hypothetical protein ACT7C8_32065 [Bacillus cereus]
MSSACTCHVNPDKCVFCKWTRMKVGTFGTNTSCGAAIEFPDGKMMRFHTLDMIDAHEVADVLGDLVIGFEAKEKKND